MLALAVGPEPTTNGGRPNGISIQAGDGRRERLPNRRRFQLLLLELEPGVTQSTAWERRTLCVVRIRDDDADQPPVLVVEDVAG